MDQIIYQITLYIFMATACGLFFWVHFHLFLDQDKKGWKHQQLRLLAGILTLIIFVLFSYLVFYYKFRDHGANNLFAMVALFSSLIIAQCGLAVYSLSDRRLISWKLSILHYIVPVSLLVGYGSVCYFFDDVNEICWWIRAASWFYYACYSVAMYYIALKLSREFRQRLEDNYVEIEKRQVLYSWRAVLYLVTILFFFIVFVLVPDYTVHSIYFVLSTIGWSYFTSVTIHLKDSPLAYIKQEAPVEAAPQEEKEPQNIDMLADSPVMQRLSLQLDEVLLKNKLYLDPDLDISMLSAALCTNRTYISRLLRMRGTSFSRYVNSLRLTHAEEMLRNSLKPVNEICEECGFSDATFRRVFTERYNCTPAEYRRSLQMKK